MKAIVATAIVAALIGFGVYAARIVADEDPPRSNSDARPVVEGRVVSVIFGETSDGKSYTSYCESDAVVNVRRGEVTALISQGAGEAIAVGTRIVEDLDTPREGVETGSPGTEYSNIKVYWGQDGELHVGCAPESVTVYR